MERPGRNANPSQMLTPSRTFFVSAFLQYRQYFVESSVKAGPVESPEEYPYSFAYLAKRKAAGAKAR
jgi:hypothetical protein